MTLFAMEATCEGATGRVKGLSIYHFWPCQQTYDSPHEFISQQVRMLVQNFKLVGPKILSFIYFYTSITYFIFLDFSTNGCLFKTSVKKQLDSDQKVAGNTTPEKSLYVET